MDIKQGASAHALLTLGKDMTFRDVSSQRMHTVHRTLARVPRACTLTRLPVRNERTTLSLRRGRTACAE